MIKMTNELFEKFATKQEQLDSMIREKLNITEQQWEEDYEFEHNAALKVEIHEFFNECHDLWKYWKQKAVNPDRIIEEAVDVIHFLHLIINRDDRFVPSFDGARGFHVNHINIMLNYIEWTSEEKYPSEAIRILMGDSRLLLGNENIFKGFYNQNDLYTYYAAILYVLDHYGFTLDDIEQAYDKKNKENHTRQANNY